MRRSTLLLLCLPVLFAGKCKDKKATDLDIDDGIDVTPPEVSLQVNSIDPDQVDPGASFRATIYGTGIEDGAQVWIGETEIASVAVPSPNVASISSPPLANGVYDVVVRNPGGDSATLRGGLRVELRADVGGLDCDAIQVRFALDSSVLDGAAQAELRSKARCFDLRGGQVRVEGHCDERGTTEYNLALGHRRADAIERFLVAQGVAPSRIRTVSYGEERPADRGHDEAAWAANRRGEVIVQP